MTFSSKGGIGTPFVESFKDVFMSTVKDQLAKDMRDLIAEQLPIKLNTLMISTNGEV